MLYRVYIDFIVFCRCRSAVLCGADHGADLDQHWKEHLLWISCILHNHTLHHTLACFLCILRHEVRCENKMVINQPRLTLLCLNIRAFAVVFIRSAGDVEDKDPAAVSRLHDLASPCFTATPSPVAPAHRCWHTLLLRAVSTGAWVTHAAVVSSAVWPWISYMLISIGERSQRRLPESEQAPLQPWLKVEKERMKSSSSGL